MNFRIASGVDRTLRLVNFSVIHVSILRPQIKIFTEYIKSPSEPLTRNTVGGNNNKKLKLNSSWMEFTISLCYFKTLNENISPQADVCNCAELKRFFSLYSNSSLTLMAVGLEFEPKTTGRKKNTSNWLENHFVSISWLITWTINSVSLLMLGGLNASIHPLRQLASNIDREDLRHHYNVINKRIAFWCPFYRLDAYWFKSVRCDRIKSIKFDFLLYF